MLNPKRTTDRIKRRRFLQRVGKALGAGLGATLLIPSTIAALGQGVWRRPGPAWRSVGRLEDFPLGEVRPARVDIPHKEDWMDEPAQRTVYVWRPGEGDVVVFSRNCTDLNCPLHFDAASQLFFCPCHGGIFRKNGDVAAGPPHRPMWRYAVRIRDGVIEIDKMSLPAAV